MNYKCFVKFVSAIISFFALSIPILAFADDENNIAVGIKIPGSDNKFEDYMGYIQAIYAFAMKIGVGAATLMIIYAGYRYMTSQGNPSAINEAKEIIIGSLTGLAMLFLIYFILTLTGLPPTK